MSVTMEEIHILIQENALQEMELREQRLLRQFRRLQEELDTIGNDIREKKFQIAAARDRFLRRCV
jgi:hypothetical protein